MPAFVPVTLRDDTPADVIFDPVRIENGVAKYANMGADGVPVGAKTLALSIRRNEANIKPRIALSLPVVATEVVNGVSSPKVIRTAYAEVFFTFSRTSTLLERKDAIAMVAYALTTSITTNAIVEDLKDVY